MDEIFDVYDHYDNNENNMFTSFVNKTNETMFAQTAAEANRRTPTCSEKEEKVWMKAMEDYDGFLEKVRMIKPELFEKHFVTNPAPLAFYKAVARTQLFSFQRKYKIC